MPHHITDNCILCGNCVDDCPVDAISEGNPFRIDSRLCIDCGACAVVCPADSILSQAQRLRLLGGQGKLPQGKYWALDDRRDLIARE